MEGHRSYRVTLEASLAKRNLLPNAIVPNIIWHVVVEEHCNMDQLLEAISKEAKFCSSADLTSVKSLVENGNFHIGQYRNPTGKVSSTSKPKVHYAEHCEQLVFSGGYYDVYAARMPRKPRHRKKKNRKVQKLLMSNVPRKPQTEMPQMVTMILRPQPQIPEAASLDSSGNYEVVPSPL